MDGPSRPNVVVVMADQLRFDHLGCTGNPTVRTPNIDGLAETGVQCTRTYVSNPLCMPSRATIFSGLMPRNHGVRTNGVPLAEDVRTVPEAFRSAGYRTHAAGKLHHHNYSLPLDHVVGLLEAGERSLDDFPPAFRERIEGAHDELDLVALADRSLPEPHAFPESSVMWKTARISSLPEPYYGFEKTDFVAAHGDGVYGEYLHWLEREHPDSFERLPRSHPDNEPGNAPQSWRWALPEAHHYNRWVADRAREFIRRAGSEPFFLLCSFPDPHHPYAAPEPWASAYDPDEVSLPIRREGELDDLPPFYEAAYEGDIELSGLLSAARLTDDELREMIAITYGMVSFVDQEVGRVLATLDAEGLEEDTLVLFLSDHGDMMGDHWMVRKGPFHFDGLLRIPMIWRWPDRLPAGARTDGLASTVDVAPTLYDLCDVPDPNESPYTLPSNLHEPPTLQGTSLRPQLVGDADAVNEHVVVENDEDYLGLRVRSLVTDRYKLTVYPGEPYGELFDLHDDPDELHNRWDDADYEDVKRRLYRTFLDAYVRRDSGLPRRLSHAG